jgi:acyl dehydratase
LPFNADLAGETWGPIDWAVTTRRVLAYRAVLAPDDAAGLDDARPGGLAMSPMAVVSPEWVLALLSRADPRQTLSEDEGRRGVHAGQDSRFLRPVAAGESLRVEARLLGARASRAGTVAAILYSSFDAAGHLVIESLSTSVYRGVAMTGAERAIPSIGPFDFPEGRRFAQVPTPLSPGLPHLYSECAEIWNPIHTEREVALAAGLADIIVHGTALWALAGNTVARAAGVGVERIGRLAARFEAPALTGARPTLELAEGHDGFRFRLVGQDGQRLMSGLAELA